MPRIDAHHHLWRYNNDEFAWINNEMSVLRRDFLPADLIEAAAPTVEATVVVQARRTLDETEWLLACAKANPILRGVVGWVPLLADDLPKILDEFVAQTALLGFREIVQAEPAGWLDQAAFDRGIAELTRRGYTYDLLLRADQLAEAARLVDRHPGQRFFLDHAAKPRIASGELEPWRTQILELAKRENVACKLSGLVTEANWKTWTPDQLQPYLDTCVEAFGVDRLLAGSDWPVCLVASSYKRWWKVLEGAFTEAEQERVFGGNALGWYWRKSTLPV